MALGPVAVHADDWTEGEDSKGGSRLARRLQASRYHGLSGSPERAGRGRDENWSDEVVGPLEIDPSSAA